MNVADYQYSNRIIVIGHRHPDTDSICSAIAYAWLKNRLGGAVYEARRAGDLNRETEFVLRYFGAEPEAGVLELPGVVSRKKQLIPSPGYCRQAGKRRGITQNESIRPVGWMLSFCLGRPPLALPVATKSFSYGQKSFQIDML